MRSYKERNTDKVAEEEAEEEAEEAEEAEEEEAERPKGETPHHHEKPQS